MLVNGRGTAHVLTCYGRCIPFPLSDNPKPNYQAGIPCNHLPKAWRSRRRSIEGGNATHRARQEKMSARDRNHTYSGLHKLFAVMEHPPSRHRRRSHRLSSWPKNIESCWREGVKRMPQVKTGWRSMVGRVCSGARFSSATIYKEYSQ